MEKRTVVQRVQPAVALALLLLALFGAAGRLDWIRGWIYVAEYLVGMASAWVVMRRVNPELIEARSTMRHPGTKRFDKFILGVYIPMTLVQPAVAGLDAVRFGWSEMPEAALYIGVILFAAGIAITTWALAVNPFAETTVRIQTERGHRVIGDGPYGFVRHPLYVGIILIHIAGGLILGSYWALAVAGFVIALFVVRTALEDRTLQSELPGYRDFASRTRWRLVPGLW